MGQSTNAHLIYGRMIPDWDESYGLPETSGDLFSSVLEQERIRHEKYFVENPLSTCEYRPYNPEDLSIHDLDDWLKNHENSKELTVVSHCSSDYPMWIIGYRDTYKTAYRGGPVTLGRVGMPSDALLKKRSEDLKRFCDVWEIPYKGEPAWLLFSDWC